MSKGTIELKIDGYIARVVVRQPHKFNAMSRSMWRDMREVFDRIKASGETRCVVLRGADGHFCAGGDISEYPTFRFDSDSLHDFHENDVWGGLQAILDCDAPVIAQIQGNCMGAGIEMACCCDLRIAGESARFGAPIAHLGFPMAPREAQLVARELGLSVTREMLLCAAVMDARTMRDRGFLNKMVQDDELDLQTEGLAQHVAALAPQAARLNKQTLRRLLMGQSWAKPHGGAVCTDGQGGSSAYDYAGSSEHREGIGAFMDKRKPVF